MQSTVNQAPVNVNQALEALLKDIDVVHRFAERSRSFRRIKELEA